MEGLGGALSRVSPRFTTVFSGAASGWGSGSPKGLRSRGGGRGGVGCGEAADGSKFAKFAVSMIVQLRWTCCVRFFLLEFDCAALYA